MNEKISLLDVLTLFEEKEKMEELKNLRELTVEEVLERMLIVLHRHDKRIERIEKVTRLMARAIENLRETTELIVENANENNYRSFVAANKYS
jgi:predicted dinucleotide-utilizing enzyme